MIRSVIMVAVKPGVTDEQIEAFGAALAAVPFARRRAYSYGRDLGLRDDTMDLIMVSDFDDADAYRDWLVDPEHRRLTAELLHPIMASISRGQFTL